jgi:hypothetical protein
VKRFSRRLLLAGAVLSGGFGLREAWRLSRPQVLRFFVERDYGAERVVNHGGWLISATEAGLFRIAKPGEQ